MASTDGLDTLGIPRRTPRRRLVRAGLALLALVAVGAAVAFGIQRWRAPRGPRFTQAAVTRGGVLFLEDVNEHPYRIERSLLQLHQAGVLDAQKAVLLGEFSDFRKSPLDRGYTLKSMVSHLRSVTKTPILTGLPFGHVPTKVTMPVGARVQLLVQGRDVLLGW